MLRLLVFYVQANTESLNVRSIVPFILGQFWATPPEMAREALIRNIIETTIKQEKSIYYRSIKYGIIRYVSHYESVGRGFESLSPYQKYHRNERFLWYFCFF